MEDEIPNQQSGFRDNHTEEGKKLLASIKQQKFTITNYKETYRGIKSNNGVMETTINNLQQDFTPNVRKLKTAYDDIAKNPENINANYVPKEISNLQATIINILQKILLYKTLQCELAMQGLDKSVDLLDASGAMEVERDYFKQLRDIDDRRNTMFMEQTRIVNSNSIRSMQQITDNAFNQNRDTIHILVKQNQDMYTLFLDIVSRLKLNNALPDSDIKELSHQAMESRKEFITAIKEREQKNMPNLQLEEAPPVPPLIRARNAQQQPQQKPKKDEESLDFDDVGMEESP